MNTPDNQVEINPIQPQFVPIETQNQLVQESIYKSRKSISPVILVLSLLIVVVIAGIAYMLGTLQSKSSPLNVQTKIDQITEIEPSPTNTDALPTQILDSIPEENSLYLGTYEGKDGIFLTDKEKQRYFDSGSVAKTSPYIGELKMLGGVGYSPFDYKKLENPKKILSNSSKTIENINSFITNTPKSFIYVSLNYKTAGGQYPNISNSIMQISSSGNKSNELWSNVVGSNKYPKAGGTTYLEQVINDKFITFNILDCYACEASVVGKIILNIKTKNEKFYEMIGDLKFDLDNNTFTYKKLAPFKEACEPSPGCDGGQRTIMSPSGEVLTDKLP